MTSPKKSNVQVVARRNLRDIVYGRDNCAGLIVVREPLTFEGQCVPSMTCMRHLDVPLLTFEGQCAPSMTCIRHLDVPVFKLKDEVRHP